jgi:hypothetical protein
MPKSSKVEGYQHVRFKEYSRGRKNLKPFHGSFTINKVRYMAGDYETAREAAMAVDLKLIHLKLAPKNILKPKEK